MAVLFGDKRRFAVEVGDWIHPVLRRVGLWAADQWLTCDDNGAYVIQFRRSVQTTADWVRAGNGLPLPYSGLSPAATHRRFIAATGTDNEDEELREKFWFFQWGPTTDNVSAYLFRHGDDLVLTFGFNCEEYHLKHPEHAGAVIVVEIQASEFTGILDDLVAALHEDANPLEDPSTP